MVKNLCRLQQGVCPQPECCSDKAGLNNHFPLPGFNSSDSKQTLTGNRSEPMALWQTGGGKSSVSVKISPKSQAWGCKGTI